MDTPSAASSELALPGAGDDAAGRRPGEEDAAAAVPGARSDLVAPDSGAGEAAATAGPAFIAAAAPLGGGTRSPTRLGAAELERRVAAAVAQVQIFNWHRCTTRPRRPMATRFG